MKKSLILGLAVALVGSSAAVGGAFALYKKAAEDVSIHIGARTDTDFNYQISDVAWNSGTYNPLQPNVTNTLNFKIGGQKSSETTYTQDTFVGKLSVSIVCADTDFIDYFDGKISATVAYGENTYYSKDSRNVLTLAKSETTGNLEGSIQVPAAFASKQSVSMPIAVPSDIPVATLYGFEGASYTVNIAWDEPDDYGFAYVVGTMTGWDFADEWRMAPAIDTEAFEWRYVPDSTHKAALSTDVEFKCKNGANWSKGGNYKVTEEISGKVNKITWTGQGSPDGQSGDGLVATLDA